MQEKTFTDSQGAASATNNIPISVKLGIMFGIFLAIVAFCVVTKTIPALPEVFLIIVLVTMRCIV